MNNTTISSLSFFLTSNYHTYGIQNAMLDFLRRHKVKQIYFLNHPLHGVAKDNTTVFEVFNTSYVKQPIVRRPPVVEAFAYLTDIFLTVKLGLSQPGIVDVFVGFNSLNAISGCILKACGKVRFVINYSHSYKTQRYKNIISNFLYKVIDLGAITFSDSTWGLGSALYDIRVKQGVPIRKIVTTHDGVDTKAIRPRKYVSKNRFHLIFVGLINEINGLELAVRSLPELVLWNANIHMTIIGEGEDLDRIKAMIKKDGMKRHVRLLGIQSIETLAKLLPHAGIGIATYKPTPHNTIATTDPMKTKLYMAAGLPIVSTDIYASAHEIADHDLGILIQYDQHEYVRAIQRLTEKRRHQKYRNNCLSYVKKYDWDTVFRDSFHKIGMII